MSDNNGNGEGHEYQVTPASEFRAMREQGVVQRLLSGRTVRLRTVTPDRLLKLGHLPDILTPLVTKMIYQDVNDQELKQFIQPRDTVTETLELLESLRIVCEAGLISPRIVDNPQADDEIRIDDLTLAERGYVFRLVFQPAEVLRTFRYEPTRDVDAAHKEQGIPQPTE